LQVATSNGAQAATRLGRFWLAYILTCPLGASFADWLGKAFELGGVGVGTGAISLVLAVFIVGFVAALIDSSPDGQLPGAVKPKAK